MSSLRNAVKRITHKERAQPQARAKLGFLEKKQDYVKRAKNYHQKEDRIIAMQEKAAMRNPDEFYFGMHQSEVKDGHHRKTDAAKQKEMLEKVGHDTIRIMKDQDLGYIRMQKQKEIKKVDRLQSSLHFLDQTTTATKKRKHTIFVDSQEEADTFDVTKHFDTLPELAGRAFNRPRVEEIRKAALQASGYAVSDDDDDKEAVAMGEDNINRKLTREELSERAKDLRNVRRKLAKARSAAYGELEARMKRVATLERAESHLVTEKLVAGKGRKRMIRPAESGKPAQYKWRQKRLG